MKKVIILLAIIVGSVSAITAQDYVPLVREGVKWKCGILYNSSIAPDKNHITPYTIYFERDTTIGDYSYKNCLIILDGYNDNISDSTIIGFAREDIVAKKVYFILNQKYSTDNSDIGRYYHLLNYFFDVNEFLWYDFNDISQSTELKNNGYDSENVIIDSIKNSGKIYKRHLIDDEIEVIEGVGCGGAVNSYIDEYKAGDLLVMIPPMTAGMVQWCPIFYHLEDADGNIIYDAPNDPPGIGGIGEAEKAGEEAVEVARYDVHGRRLAKLMPGINIIRMSDGTVRKVIERKL